MSDPAGMPVFTIKGKDKLAPAAIAEYMKLCTRRQLHGQAAEVEMAWREITAWQAAHPDLVQLPDHKHVPVAYAPAAEEDTTQSAAKEPSPAEQIRALLPEHTHEQLSGGGFLAPPLATAWTWTTPLGTWTVHLGKSHLLAPTTLSLTGPGGAWTFAWPDQRGVSQLAVVLRVLDAIEG